MIIKISNISSSHGHNAISYALTKNQNEKKGAEEGKKDVVVPDFLDSHFLPNDDILGTPVSPTTAYTNMMIRQTNSGHHVKDGFFRIEICPAPEECEGWTHDDWQRCLDDAIRHLDTVEMRNKAGKVYAAHLQIAKSQYVAAIHRDTDKPHIHLVVNRITEENKLQDANYCGERAKRAAEAMSLERGWTLAKDIDGERKERIHDDALDVLRSMDHYSLAGYFAGMRAKGWIIKHGNSDRKGMLHGYSIGQELRKKDGSLSSTVIYNSSKLGFGRDLTIKNLENTWRKLHQNDVRVSQPTTTVTPGTTKPVVPSVPSGSTVAPDVRRPSAPRWECSEVLARDFGQKEETMVTVPSLVSDIINKDVKPLNPMDYKEPNNEIPTQPAIVAAAFFEFLVAADVQVSAGGGGGGGSNDLRWDGKTKDDLENLAHGAAKTAMAKSTAKLTKRGGVRR